MKHLKHILTILVVALTISCSKKDDDSSNPASINNPLFGKWNLISYQSGERGIVHPEKTKCPPQGDMLFKNTTEVELYGNFPEKGIDCKIKAFTCKYQIKDNIMTIVTPDETITYLILIVNETTLKVQFVEKDGFKGEIQNYTKVN